MKGCVNWFEIAVTDIARAKTFYEKVLDIKMTDVMSMSGIEMSCFPMASAEECEKACKETGHYGIPGALIKGKDLGPSTSGTTVYFACQDVAVESSRVGANGGKVIVPKMAIGEHGFIAQCIDTEGNRFALHSMK